MTSTAEEVRRCIGEDVFLQEALGRGIVNYRKMAEWLQEHRGLEGDKDNVAQAIPRNEPGSENQAMVAAWESLQEARVDQRSGLGALEVDLTGSAVESIQAAATAAGLARGGTFQLLHEDSALTVILEEDVLTEVREEFPEGAVRETQRDLAELRVVPEASHRLHPAVSSLVVAALAVGDRGPRFTVDRSSTLSVFVDGTDSRGAFDLLERLTG